MTDPLPSRLVDPAAPGFSEILVEAVRGGILESVHRGAIAICTPSGEVVWRWARSVEVSHPGPFATSSAREGSVNVQRYVHPQAANAHTISQDGTDFPASHAGDASPPHGFFCENA